MAPANDKTVSLAARIIRKRTKRKTATPSTAPGSGRPHAAQKKKEPTHKANTTEKSKATATPNTRQSSPTPKVLVFQFQDDKTGRKLIHPSALRYSLKLVEDELQTTTKAVAQSLLEHNQLDESRTVHVRSLQHGKEIVAKVRERLRKVPIPARYIRIDDVNLADLDAANKKRIDEIEVSKAMLKKLQKQKALLEMEHSEAKLARDESLIKRKEGQKEDMNTKESTEFQVHPLLHKASVEVNRKQWAFPEESRPLLVKRPDDEAKVFSALLEKLPSAYA